MMVTDRLSTLLILYTSMVTGHGSFRALRRSPVPLWRRHASDLHQPAPRLRKAEAAYYSQSGLFACDDACQKAYDKATGLIRHIFGILTTRPVQCGRATALRNSCSPPNCLVSQARQFCTHFPNQWYVAGSHTVVIRLKKPIVDGLTVVYWSVFGYARGPWLSRNKKVRIWEVHFQTWTGCLLDIDDGS